MKQKEVLYQALKDYFVTNPEIDIYDLIYGKEGLLDDIQCMTVCAIEEVVEDCMKGL